MKISVEIRHRLDRFLLDVSFESGPGVTALFGASGSGKTSVVNVIAGLVRPEHGRVTVDGDVLLDTSRGRSLAKHRRRIGYVFQEARLFPHLTVRHNLLYGRWFAPAPKSKDEVEQVVDMLAIARLLDRRPVHLSGGEKQRVAIGRALLARPRLLLMDEPLAALDDQRKAEILPYIERLRDEARVPVVYVSHSVPEVARLAANVIVLAKGRVVATGPVSKVMSPLRLPRDEDAEVLEGIERSVESFGRDRDRRNGSRWAFSRS
jgi:molybdate transport system ATP-binding protein